MPAHPIDVVIVTIGSAGDLFPFLRIGTTLRDLGHRVSCIAPWLHQPYVEQAGLPFHGVDIDAAVLDDPDLWHPLRGFGVVWRATRPAMAQVQALAVPLLTSTRSLIIAHPLALPEADLIRAARPGVTIVAGILAPQNLPTVHDPMMAGPRRVPGWVPQWARRLLWRGVGTFLLDPVALGGINAARAAQGRAPVPGLLQHLATAPDLTLLLFPAWFAPPQEIAQPGRQCRAGVGVVQRKIGLQQRPWPVGLGRRKPRRKQQHGQVRRAGQMLQQAGYGRQALRRARGIDTF